MSRRQALLLFVAIVIIWGINWTVTKLIVLSVTPIWSTAIRSLIAAVALFILQLLTKQFVIPKRQDIPAIIVIGVFHMVLFGALMAIGLQYASVGRSIILAYSTPLWVTPAAILILREPASKLRIFGVLLGIVGIITLFDPTSSNIKNNEELFGNLLLILASLSWALAIVFIKVHKWHSSPFQLVFWQNLLAFLLLAVVAFFFEGKLKLSFDINLIWQFAYNGLLATAFGFWAMTVVSKHLPAIVTSLGMLATPVVGIACSQIVFGETLDTQLVIAGLLIFSGIALGSANLKNK